jgi:CheY-like chemotaxis protein
MITAGRGCLSAHEGAAEVLVVDDDELLLGALVQLVSQLGYPAIGAASGHEALAYLHKTAALPRLILADLFMPIMSGDELVMRLRDEPAFAAIPVVILTASRQLVAAVAGDATAVPVLAKSLRPKELVAFIEANCPRRCGPVPPSVQGGIAEPSIPA